MLLQPVAIDIFLQPGEVYFGDSGTRIRTLLGSCVAITVWHPRKKIGGMCHYLLPGRSGSRVAELDGRYADEALSLLLREIADARTEPSEYQVKIFGGGNMFVDRRAVIGARAMRRQALHIGGRNIAVARDLLLRRGLIAMAEHVGGAGHRQIIFELSSGDVWLRQHNNNLQLAEAP